ncbi:conserved Plasmodium protein, unknown function [Plasmodium malariae]|uniref:Dynein regulatory complex subunit 7 MORN domain-containing protein n=1 Tax=Plasmodium malariae TaxID=5858 RepID=A0A1A8WU17_PLAMA|nr:conserved Plasmodium protein, unknown function [Plasmodium malariae]
MTDIKEKKKKYEKLMNVGKTMLRENKYEDEKVNLEEDFYIHMWILIKKSLDLRKDVFIEMSSGKEYDIDDCPYRSIFYLWNEKNVYININKTEKIKILISQLKNKEYFVPAFYEEIKNKVKKKDKTFTKKGKYRTVVFKFVPALTPIVENKFYVIRKDRFLLKYPHGSKTTFYNNCKKDEYGYFLQHDGLTEMHTHYTNKFYTDIESVCSFYKHRRDRKRAKIYLPQKFKTIEYYDDCGHQRLKKLEQIKDYKLMEYFINRNDESVKLSKNENTIYKLKTFEGDEYYVTKITVKYRNKNAKNGIKKKVFLIPENKIILVYYNEYNKISNVCEVYEKCIRYNEDTEEDEEVIAYKRNFIYKHFVNYQDSTEGNKLYLLKEEGEIFQDIKNIYDNVICSIIREKKEIKRMEDAYQYMPNNITNINEIVYHENNEIDLFNKKLMQDNLNVYNFYYTYPWNNHLDISMENNFFSSKKKMLTVECACDEITYIASEKKNEPQYEYILEGVSRNIKKKK